jgi:hypothetical protein
MDDDKTPPPSGRSAVEIRREREAEALRLNLRRRKEQKQARAMPTRDPPRETARDDEA